MSARLRELQTAVINYTAERCGYTFDPRTLSTEDIDAIGEVMVNGDVLDVAAVTMLATLRADHEAAF